MPQSLTSIRLRRQWVVVDSIKLHSDGYVECWVGAACISFLFKTVMISLGSVEDFETVVKFDSPHMLPLATTDVELYAEFIEFAKQRKKAKSA